jgi:hypothetical protein
MPLGRNPAERYALRLRSACEKINWKSGTLDMVGQVERVKAEHGSALGPGYEFTIYASSSGKRGLSNPNGALAFIHVSDTGRVTIDVDESGGEEFPEDLLECVVHRAEILR